MSSSFPNISPLTPSLNLRAVPFQGALRSATAVAAALVLCMAAGCGGGGGSSSDPAPASASQAGTSSAGGAATTGTSNSLGATGAGTPTSVSSDSGATNDAAGTQPPPDAASVAPGATDPSSGDASLSGNDGADAAAGSAGLGVIGGVTAPATGATGSGKTYVVGSTGTLVAGGTRVASMMAVPWSSLPAGSIVYVSPGTYPGVTTITSVGTKANPIIVTATDPAHPPVLSDSVDFQHAAYVLMSHVTVQAPTYAGFIIRLASNHITVSDSTINKAPLGVTITDAAGTGHQLLRNTIADTQAHGISVDVNSDPAERTLIAHNTIVRSGQHGMEIRASHYQVDDNTVSQSGYANGGGISGIHLYSGSAAEDSGDDNLVRYNLSYANIDKVAVDGNGIEVDQWCDRNTVAFNQAWGNDGAGIIVYDGSTNLVQNNTTWDNGHDSGGTHVSLGEIIVSGTSATTVKANHVWNNLSFSTRANVPALYVDTRAVSGGNTIGANLYYNAAAGAAVRWTDSLVEKTAAAIDAVTHVAGSVVALPAFVNTATPLSNGLALKTRPALNGVLPTGLADFAGVAPVSGDAFFGAYYTAP